MDLDHQHYKLLADFERYFADGAPSLGRGDSLKVSAVRFAAGVVCLGNVEFITAAQQPRPVPAGTYRDVQLRL